MRDAGEGQEGMYRKEGKGREGQTRERNRVVWDRGMDNRHDWHGDVWDVPSKEATI